MAAISLILIASLVVLATLINTGLHRLRVESALSAKNNAVYYLIHQALTTNQHNGVIGAGEFDVKQLIKACARSKLETPRRNENFKLMERLSCDLKSNLQLELEVMLVKTTGYNPGIQLLMGFTNQTKLIFVRVLEHYETANFGTRLLAPGNEYFEIAFATGGPPLQDF